MALLQPKEDLERIYGARDPYGYDEHPDDRRRVARLLAHLPRRPYPRTLDIGCGNGFLTVHLPGDEVVGADVSERAVAWARERAELQPERTPRFVAASLFDLPRLGLGQFDLVVVTGVLYPQYIARATSVVTETLKTLLRPGGVLVTVHIDAWCDYRPPFTMLTASIDPYREHLHRLEVFQR
jgi:2-polyprenyl-3-methyl-5-hydroxy-6-metoxy-1,4-benzoquinol methylase